jgi:hypothetical protein
MAERFLLLLSLNWASRYPVKFFQPKARFAFAVPPPKTMGDSVCKGGTALRLTLKMSMFCYRLTMTSEAQQLPRIKPKYGLVRLSTPSGNAGSIYLSDSPANAGTTTTRFAIAANVRFPLRISDLGLLWVSGNVSDCLDLLCETGEGGANVNEASIQVG